MGANRIRVGRGGTTTVMLRLWSGDRCDRCIELDKQKFGPLSCASHVDVTNLENGHNLGPCCPTNWSAGAGRWWAFVSFQSRCLSHNRLNTGESLFSFHRLDNTMTRGFSTHLKRPQLTVMTSHSRFRFCSYLLFYLKNVFILHIVKD